MIVDIDKNEFVALIRRRMYMEGYSNEALEKIFEIEDELSEGELNKYALDTAYIRGGYTEYKTVAAAAKDLGYEDEKDLERHFNIFKLYNSVLVMRA